MTDINGNPIPPQPEPEQAPEADQTDTAPQTVPPQTQPQPGPHPHEAADLAYAAGDIATAKDPMDGYREGDEPVSRV